MSIHDDALKRLHLLQCADFRAIKRAVHALPELIEVYRYAVLLRRRTLRYNDRPQAEIDLDYALLAASAKLNEPYQDPPEIAAIRART